MVGIKTVAKELHMKPDELLHDSLKVYIGQKISKVESELFLIAKKYGIKDIFELDRKIKDGFVKEDEAYDDYFMLDNLEAEREKLKQFIENL